MKGRTMGFKSFLAFGLSLALLVGGCTTNPATGRSQFNTMSTSQEIAHGEKAAPEFRDQYGGEIPSQAIREYVSNLGQRLAEVSERPDLPWEFFVVDSQVINAFALPGGKVFVSRGLVEKLDSEAQLAGVLGHEVGHVTAQHIGQQMSQALIVQGLAIGVGVAAQSSDDDWMQVLGVGAQVGGTVYLLKFGREQEHEADELGLRYMTKLGYNPVGQLQVMEILRDESAGQARGPEFLSTHPLPQSRIDRLERIIHERYPQFEDPAKYWFGFDSFKTTVLDKLGKLGPPKHTRDQPTALLPCGHGGVGGCGPAEHGSLAAASR